MALITEINLLVSAVQSANTGYQGGTRAVIETRESLASGTAANQADLKHASSRSVSASSNEDVDLRALTDGQGNTLTGLTEIVTLAIKAASTNGGTLRVKPSASNGWTGLFSGSSNYILIKPGTTFIVHCPGDGQYSVGGTTKSINVENTDSGAAGSYELVVIGRSA